MELPITRNRNRNRNGNRNRNPLSAIRNRISQASILLCLAVFALSFYIDIFNITSNLDAHFPNEFEKGGEFQVQEQEKLNQYVFHKPEVFLQSYEAMEKHFKVFVYPAQDPYPCGQELNASEFKYYSSEVYFYERLRESQFVTKDPEEADLFFIPLSCEKEEESASEAVVYFDLVDVICNYPYWNRTIGADHIFVVYDNYAAMVTPDQDEVLIQKNSIRVVGLATYKSAYNPHKDVALPEIWRPIDDFPPAGTNIARRIRLGFWVGRSDLGVANAMVSAWSRDEEFDIWSSDTDRDTIRHLYRMHFYSTKFCICPPASQVEDTFVAEAIHFGCVPVIISDYYDLPFNDILDWKKFAVIVKEDDVYLLKKILKSIPFSKYMQLQKNLVTIQRHFRWNSPPKKYDAFHMVMYELWLRRHVIRY